MTGIQPALTPTSPVGGEVVGPELMRQVMSQFATGVVVVTVGHEHLHAMTANAFTSVSLTPPMVLCCVAHTAVMHGAITSAGSFGISILHADQVDLARHFADKSRPLGPAQFDGIDWRPGPRTGAPLLAGAVAWLECTLAQAYPAGDHSIFLGAVLGAGRQPAGHALAFYDGRFARLGGGS